MFISFNILFNNKDQVHEAQSLLLTNHEKRTTEINVL